MKHLLKMSDLTPDEVAHILDVADELKAQQKAGGTGGDSAVTNLNDYRSILSACHVGEELGVYIYRDGRQYYTDVTLTGKGESPSEIATEQMQNETE